MYLHVLVLVGTRRDCTNVACTLVCSVASRRCPLIFVLIIIMLPSPVLSLSASSTPPLHVLRGILRHVKSSPSHQALASASAPNTSRPQADGGKDMSEVTLRDYVLAEYRKNMSVPPQRGAMLRRIAYDYLVLKDDLTERARLHQLDGGADTKLSPAELTRRAAARAGLQVPKLDPDL